MAKVTLIVEKNPILAQIYRLNLNTYVGVDATIVNNIVDAINFIENNSELALIIFRKEGKNFEVFLPELNKRNKNIPIIIIGSHDVFSDTIIPVKSGIEIKPIIKSAAQFLGVTAQDMVKLSVPEYFPFHIEYFKNLKRTCSKLFLETSGVYFEISQEYSNFAPELIEGLESKGVKELYCEKNQRLKLVNHITSELVGDIEDKELNESEQIQANDINRANLTQKLKILGVEEETIKLAKKNLKSISDTCKRTPLLTKLFEKLNANKASYLYLHTQLVTYIGLHIMGHIDWGNEEQKEKFSFIAYFHDIVLETDIQGKIHSKEELKKSKLSSEEQALVEKHAQMAGELVHKFPRAPLGADQIIKQHHGMLNGIGFSEHFGANLSPVTIIFILSEELTRIILEKSLEQVNLKESLKVLRDKFPTARFAKIIDIMESIPI
jgi:hypothetical protein